MACRFFLEASVFEGIAERKERESRERARRERGRGSKEREREREKGYHEGPSKGCSGLLDLNPLGRQRNRGSLRWVETR